MNIINDTYLAYEYNSPTLTWHMNIINNTFSCLTHQYIFLQTDSQILKVHIIRYPKVPISENPKKGEGLEFRFLAHGYFTKLVHFHS